LSIALLGVLVWSIGPAVAATFEAGDATLDWTNDIQAIGLLQQRPLLTPSSYGAAPGYATQWGSAGRTDWMSKLDLSQDGLGIRLSVAVSAGELYQTLDPGASVLALVRYSNLPTSLVVGSTALRHQEIEPLDAYFHDDLTLGSDQHLTLRVGRQVLIWGQSLFFPQNGVAAGQAPIDDTRWPSAASYGGTNYFRPVGQVSANWQIGDGLSLEAYWQFEYRTSRIAEIGDYGRPTAVVPSLTQNSYGPTTTLFYSRSSAPPNPLGQAGAALDWQSGDLDLGVYGERYTAKTPTIELDQGMGSYNLIYPSGIELLGIGLSRRVGDVDFGLEVSARHGMPLVTAAVTSDRVPTGDTLHLNASWQYTTPPLPVIGAGALWSGEIALNQVASATDAAELLPGRTRFAAAFRTTIEPTFYQILPRIDLSVPLGFGYGLIGRSDIDPSMTSGVGTLQAGLSLHIDQAWRTTLDVTHYLGAQRALFIPFAFNQAADPLAAAGNFVRLSVERAF
jgi:hypothetical protein